MQDFARGSEALRVTIDAAKPGVSVLSLCVKGDAFIMAETGKIFKKEKDMKKGETEIDLGVHVDGFISNVAHSFVIGATKEAPVTGRKADVIKAAHLCAEAALRLVKPGNQVSTNLSVKVNTQVTEAWNKIAQSFKCNPIEGEI
ncbi:hypothetical protein cypCar_00049377 [Cyprinus carpio]|nr:hypothetical protein cypCar_00049377 [Cyprinus carpio]